MPRQSSPDVLRGLSFHSPLRRCRGPLPVVARFDGTLHLQAPGAIVTLTTQDADGPFTIRVPFQLGQSVPDCSEVRLVFDGPPSAQGEGALPVDLRRARQWAPERQAVLWRRKSLANGIRKVRAAAGGSAFWGSDRLSRHLAIHRQAALAWAQAPGGDAGAWLKPLIGAGPGLTPSGDDWLIGVLTALNHLCGRNSLNRRYAILALCRCSCPRCAASSDSSARPLVQATAIAGSCRLPTTSLGRTLIRCASRGVAHAGMIGLARGLGDPVEVKHYLGQVLALGHTSGADMALGVADGAAMLQTWSRAA